MMKSFMQPITLALLMILVLVPAQLCFAFDSGFSAESELRVDAGYRSDQLDWNIAGTSAGTTPNILSELTWDDLQIYQLRLHAGLDLAMATNPWFKPSLRGQLGYGRIYSGQNQDSDYDGDNRTLEFSRSNNAADQGDVLDLSFGVGQKFLLLNGRLTLVPLVGYSYHAQNLKLMEGYQTIPADGPFAGLSSSYDTEWRGPWLGVEINFMLSDRLTFIGLSEFHRADYSAEANWNLRADLAHPLSFEQGADGYGWIHELGLKFLLRDQWSLHLSGNLQRWQTDAGYDRVFLADGTSQVTRLNRVHWASASIQAGLSYRF